MAILTEEREPGTQFHFAIIERRKLIERANASLASPFVARAELDAIPLEAGAANQCIQFVLAAARHLH